MVNILIPMAGKGQRFVAAGYSTPKPLIDVCGVPMIKRVIDSLKAPAYDIRFIFVALQEHLDSGLETYLKKHGTTVPLNCTTEGAVCTALLAMKHINDDDELVIANCDQYLEWNFGEFIDTARKYDGCLAVFNSTNPHHSYALVKKNKVVQVAEKVVISDKACAGIYYFKKGNVFVEGAVQMIAKNIRTNNEFYIAPIYNELISDKKEINVFEIDVNKKHMLGTPEELKIFLDKVENGDVTL